MWPLDRAKATEVLRIGRHAIERWQSAASGLSPMAAPTLLHTGPLDLAQLRQVIPTLYATPPQAATTVLLESCWLPVVLVEVGQDLLRIPQLEALARHRFSLLYDTAADPVSEWELRWSYRAGDRQALIYGLSPRLKQVLEAAAATLQLRLIALSPACTWGWDWLRSAGAWPRDAGWCFWPEQDRALLARIEAGKIVSLHAAAPRILNSTQVVPQVAAQQVRLGLRSAPEPIMVATWDAITDDNASDRVVWRSLRTARLQIKAPHGSRRQLS